MNAMPGDQTLFSVLFLSFYGGTFPFALYLIASFLFIHSYSSFVPLPIEAKQTNKFANNLSAKKGKKWAIKWRNL
jgi:hypothetical protein